jgi:DNA-binding MarR family transcriptional regulator
MAEIDTQAGATATNATAHDPAVIEQLDRAFLRLRRMVNKPGAATLPLASVGRRIDLAKVMACQAIADAAEPPCGGDVPTVKDVAVALDLEHSTASRLLGEAEVEGLVVRGTDPTDRRRTTLALTETGRMVLRESAMLRCGLIDELFAEWDPNDVETLATLLGRVTATLSTKLPTSMDEALDRLGIELTEDR